MGNKLGNKTQGEVEVQKDILEQLMGSMKRYQWIITISCYVVEVLLAFHCLSHGIMVPATTPIYCSNTNKTIKDVLTTEELKDLYAEACSDGCPEVIVSKRYYDNTIVHQYKLYCNNRDKYTTLAQALVMAGVLVGNLIFGYLADNYGRKYTLTIAAMAQAPAGVIVAFSPNIYCFLVFKFILNVFVGGSMVTAFVLFSECNGVKWRPITGLLANLPYTLAHLGLAGLAYIFRDWRFFELALALPALITVYYIWVLPESPRWLLTVGKVNKGIKYIEFIAKGNRMPTHKIRRYVLADIQEHKNEQDAELRKGKFTDLFQSRRMSLITIFTWINWFSIVTCYYGVAQYSASIGHNIYASFALAALTQQPSLWLVFYTISYWGRRWSLFFSNALASVSIFTIYLTPIGNYQVIPASISMFALAMSFPVIYVYSSELFPTTVRNIGMGTSSALSRIGAIFAAFIVDLRKVGEWLPPVIFASFMVLTLFGFIFLPETKGIVLPDTVEETERLKSLSSSFSNDSFSRSPSRGSQRNSR